MVSKRLQKLIGKFYIRGLEEQAFLIEVFKGGLPKIGDRALPKLYREANRVRRNLGEQPKTYYTWKKRKLVRIEGV